MTNISKATRYWRLGLKNIFMFSKVFVAKSVWAQNGGKCLYCKDISQKYIMYESIEVWIKK